MLRRLLLGAGVMGWVASCGTPTAPPQNAGPPKAAEQPPLAQPRPGHAHPVYPALAPPPVVKTAMKGAPSGAALSEARLVATTCEAIGKERIEAQLKAMRRDVDASYQSWHDAQPSCWEADRADYLSRRGNMWGDGIGDAFGAGGLGLSGVGEGGGGRGEGIGLGAVGTIGHGSGAGAAAEPKAASRASGTNNQVASVDEADLVKTDGRYVYIAANGALRIIEALSPKVVSKTTVGGTVRETFVEGNRAVVYSSIGRAAPRCTYGYDCAVAGDGSSTKISVFDLASRAEPKLVREVELSGSLIAARRIGNAVHTVVADNDAVAPLWETWPKDMAECGTSEDVVKKKFAELKKDNEAKLRAGSLTGFPTIRDRGVEASACTNMMTTALKDGQAFTSLVSFDLADDKKAAVSQSIQSRPGTVFAGSNALYVSVVHHKGGTARWYSSYSTVDEVSEIHKFEIGADPEKTKYVGSGTAPGHVLNQFSMDEWQGYLRVATTRGRVPDPKVSSAVSVLTQGDDGNLVRVGAVEGLAPGEDIRAVRFDDERAYVVTFKKTDPLFVLDLYQPAKPKVMGELKIPGFSTYIHRIDQEHLMSIGFDANDHGDFAFFDGVILQMFDVKDPTKPKLVHKEKIGTRGSASAANTDHLAFNYFANEGLLAIPMTICEGGGDGSNGDLLAFSGLLVYDVDVERGFKRLGGVDHGKRGANCGGWWSSASSAVKRSVFLDDLVYSIAPDRVKVQRMSRFGQDVADLSLL